MGTANKIVIFILTVTLPNLVAPYPGLADTNLPFKYTGNLNSRKFHRPRCPYARMMCDYKRVRFHFRRQAIAEGYKPCRYCLPPVWTTVTCVIRSQSLENNRTDKVPDKNCPLGTPQKQANISSP